MAIVRRQSKDEKISRLRAVPSAPFSESISQKPQASFRRQWMKVIRHPLIFLFCALLGLGLALAYSVVKAPQYTATATVLVYPVSADPLATASSNLKVDIATEALVAGSREVAQEAATSLGLTEENASSKILKATKVASHSQTAILDITSSSSDPAQAAARANAMADAYLKVRSENLKKDIQNISKSIQANIDELSKNATANQVTITQLREQLAQVKVSSTNTGRVTTRALAPASQSGLGTLSYLLIGLVAGLLVAIPLAYLVDSRKRKVSYSDRAEEIMGTPVGVVTGQNAVEDIGLILRRAGISHLAELSANYRGLAVYSPTPKISVAVSSLLENLVDEEDLLFTNKPVTSVTDQPVIYTLPSYSELSEVLDAAETIGHCLFAISAETTVYELKRLSNEISASPAVFIPVFILK